MALGIVMVVVGAIMRFAVSAKTSGFDIHQAGVILLLVGIGVFVVSLFVIVLGEEVAARCGRTSGKPPQANSRPSKRTTGARPKTGPAPEVIARDPRRRPLATKTNLGLTRGPDIEPGRPLSYSSIPDERGWQNLATRE
jgi:hypothetical protein